MTQKKNIAFLGNQVSPGGGSASLLLMIKSVDRTKFNVFLLSSDCASERKLAEFKLYCNKVTIDKNIKQIVSCAGHKPSYLEWLSANFSKKKQVKIILDFLKENDIDILHINNAVFSHLYKSIKNGSTVQIVSHVREQLCLFNRHLLQSYIVDRIERYSDKIVCISPNEASVFSRKDIVVAPNPFDFNELSNIVPENLRSNFGITANELIVAMHGRFAPDKGQMLFLEAVKQYKAERSSPPVKFLIIGSNPRKANWKLLIKRLLFISDYQKKLENYILENNLDKDVFIVPYTEKILTFLSSVDVVVRPSLTADPWGRDIIEAMACGKPVIATGQSDFLVKNNETGFLVPVSADSIAQKLFDLCSNKETIKSIGINAEKVIRKMSNMESYGNQISSVYN